MRKADGPLLPERPEDAATRERFSRMGWGLLISQLAGGAVQLLAVLAAKAFWCGLEERALFQWTILILANYGVGFPVFVRIIRTVPAGPARERLRAYFDARLRFFADYPRYLGIFADAALDPPAGLWDQIADRRRAFDELNISVLTGLLDSAPLRAGLSVEAVVEDFRLYLDYFNIHYRAAFRGKASPQEALLKHEERCHRQIDILLYGVMGEPHET